MSSVESSVWKKREPPLVFLESKSTHCTNDGQSQPNSPHCTCQYAHVHATRDRESLQEHVDDDPTKHDTSEMFILVMLQDCVESLKIVEGFRNLDCWSIGTEWRRMQKKWEKERRWLEEDRISRNRTEARAGEEVSCRVTLERCYDTREDQDEMSMILEAHVQREEPASIDRSERYLSLVD